MPSDASLIKYFSGKTTLEKIDLSDLLQSLNGLDQRRADDVI